MLHQELQPQDGSVTVWLQLLTLGEPARRHCSQAQHQRQTRSELRLLLGMPPSSRHRRHQEPYGG